MKKSVWIAALAAAMMTAGCAYNSGGPIYQPARSQSDNGFSEVRLDSNRYRVQYRTDVNNPSLAQDWALRRAAELTLQSDYDWFQVIRRSRLYDDDAFRRYDDYRWRYDDGRYDPRYPDYYDRDSYGDSIAVIEVVMGNAPPPRGSSIYNARQVLNYTRGRSYYDDRRRPRY